MFADQWDEIIAEKDRYKKISERLKVHLDASMKNNWLLVDRIEDLTEEIKDQSYKIEKCISFLEDLEMKCRNSDTTLGCRLEDEIGCFLRDLIDL